MLEYLGQAYRAHFFANCPANDLGKAEKKFLLSLFLCLMEKQALILPLVQSLKLKF